MTYDNDKQKRIEIFEDTINYIEHNDYLKEKVKESTNKTKIYNEDFSIKEKKEIDMAKIIVKNTRTLAALDLFSNNVKNPCILNFASATNPGGGVKRGSNAQEECLCRCSTLYNVISNKKFFNNFYKFHKDRHNTLYTNKIIYSPNIIVIKEDIKFPTLMNKEKWKTCNVISCAAPNLRETKIKDMELLNIMKDRIRCILDVAIDNNVDGIVLGAFGCGAFKCSPNVVARAFKEILINENYAKYFKEIIFAVLGVPNKDMINFDVFNRTFK